MQQRRYNPSIILLLCLIIGTGLSNAQYLSAIYISPARTTVEAGASHTLECVVTGEQSTPLFSWFLEGQPIDITDSRFLVSSGELEIQAFSPALEGAYRCTAENSVGKIVSFSLTLKLAYFSVDRSSLPGSIPIVSPNSSFSLSCPLYAVSSHPPPSVTWWYQSGQILDHYPLVVSLDYELVFSLIRQSDTGIYACRTSNSFLNVSEEFDVAAVTMPNDQSLSKVRRFYISPSNRTVALGDDVSFQCIITGSSSSQPALWKFGDTSLFDSDRILLTQNSGILTIRNVTLRDMGSYSCIDADNQQDSRLFTLSVIMPPTVISNQSLSQSPVQGSTLSLSCESVGTAPLAYSWFYNGSPLGLSSWEIELRSVSTADTGLYQCYVENSAGRDMRVFTLNVKGFEPQLTFLQRDILAFEGSGFAFGFVAYGAPAPIYTYSHNNHTLQPTDYSMLNESHYSVAAANSSHSGLYTCTISNTAGFIQYSFSILVVEPTQPYSSMAATLTALLDSSVSIACRATADANYATLTLSYRWERDGIAVSLSADRFGIIGSFGDIEITQVQASDAGSYACIAITADSGLTYESQLETLIGHTDIRIATVPDPPVTVGAVLTGESSLEVSWSPPLNSGGVAVSRYLVEYKLDSSVGWRNAGESALLALNVTYCPSLEYVFRVSAVNAVGSSEPSLSSVPIQVPAELPSVSPANLTISSIPTPTHISLAWQIPDSNTLCSGLNGNLLDHYIQYVSTSPLVTQYILTGSSQLNYTLTGLAQSTYYKIRVAFKNSVGIGEFSDHVSAMTFYDSPLNPPAGFEVESYGRGRIAVYFTAPLDNAIITGYKVRCQPEIGDVLSEFLSHDGASTLTVISNGVVDGTIYTCSVVAYNAIGDGPSTEIKTVIASERQVPNIPNDLYILPNGSYGAIFSWTAPNDTDFLLALEYKYSLTPHVLRKSAFEIASPLSTLAISSLDAGVTYSVKFAGINTDGIGFNLTSIFHLPPGRPRFPILTLSEASSGDNATLTWSISHNGGSEITSIIVQRKIRDSTWFTVATIYEYNTTSYGLSIADKGFQFRIVIHNYFGSASSTPVLFASAIARDVSPLILIAVALTTVVLALTCILFICVFVHFSYYWRQHKKSRFLVVRGSTEQSAEEESRIFRNLNNASIDDKKTELFPAQQSETSSDCTDRPPSYHSNYPSKDSKTSNKSSSSSRRKVELTEQKRQGPVKKGVLTQPGKIQSAKLPHKKVVFSEHRGQSSIDSDSTEPSQVSWTNTFNRQLRDSPTPINLEEFTPTLPSRIHVEKQPHPLNLTTNSFSNIFPGRNSDVWDFKYEQSEVPAHLISHKKSKSDELSDHYTTVQDILPIQHPALKKFRGSSGKLNADVLNKAKARSKSPISFLTQKLSPMKLKESEVPNPKANVPPIPDFSNPAFDESALSNTVFSFDQLSSRIPSPTGFEHQHTDSTQSQQASSLSSNC